jgi:DNA end-binding protein Ku
VGLPRRGPRDRRRRDRPGYERRKDQYVILSDRELEALAPEKSRDIDLRQFVPADEIPPLFLERTYYLVPAEGSTKAYRLLAAILERTGRAGVATFVMRGKEYLVALLAERGILRAETLRFGDEIRAPKDVGLPGHRSVPTRRVRAVEKAIDALARDELDPSELEDRHAEAVRAIAHRKKERNEDVVESTAADEEGDGEDLMEALRRTLGKTRAPRRTAREPARRKATARARVTKRRSGRGRRARRS